MPPAATPPAFGSYPAGAQIDRILAIADQAERNYAITQGYHDLSQAFAAVVGDENANWTTYAVWASRQAGVSIRQEDLPAIVRQLAEASGEVGAAVARVKKALGPFGGVVPPATALLGSSDRALDGVSEAIAQGNREVFAEISREFSRFIQTFGGQAAPDAEKLDAYLKSFRPDQAGLRDGMAAYAEAMFEQDPARKAEQMFRGNALVGLHEQAFLQTHIERAMNAPVEELVQQNLEKLLGSTLPGKVLSKVGVLDEVLRPLTEALSGVTRKVITDRMMSLAVPGKTLRLGDDLTGEFPDALKTIEDPALREVLAKLDRTPDSLNGTAARDWVRLDDRMNYIVDLFRAYQQRPAMFDQPFEAPIVSYA